MQCVPEIRMIAKTFSFFLPCCIRQLDLCKTGDVLPFPISMKELAKLGATTRETVNQVLKRLREEGRISYEHKQLIFTDREYFMKYFKES